MHVSIDTARNQPDIHRKKQLKWDRPHDTRVEMEMEGHYQKGPHSVEVYLKQTAIANPHLAIIYKNPQGEEIRFARSTKKLPDRAVEIKPHPYGIELGRLIQMLNNTKSRTLLGFLVDEFSCVGRKTALNIIELAGKLSDRKLSDRSHPKHIAHVQAAALHKALRPVVGVEHHLLRLARISPHKQHPAVAEPYMGGLHDHRHAIEQDDLMAPVKLVGFSRRKAQRDVGRSRRLSALPAPPSGVTAHGVVTTVITAPAQLFKDPKTSAARERTWPHSPPATRRVLLPIVLASERLDHTLVLE